MAETKLSETNDATAPFGFDTIMLMQRPALAAMAEMNSHVYEYIAAVNEEWATFVNRCLKEDIAVSRRFAQCRTTQDLYQAYTAFFQSTLAQYQSGFEQISSAGPSQSGRCSPVLETQAQRGISRFRSRAARVGIGKHQPAHGLCAGRARDRGRRLRTQAT